MPLKRRTAKRRMNAQTEIAAWSMTFQLGCDFLGDLEVLGLKGDARSDAELFEAAREASGRLGATWLRDLRDCPYTPWRWKSSGRRREPNVPLKGRLSKSKQFRISPEAVARWREVEPAAIVPPCICDDELADALGGC